MRTEIFSNFILVTIMLVSLRSFAHEGHHDKALEPAAPSTDSLYNLDSAWTDQNGKNIQLNSLKGHPAIVAMIYTSCESACPIIVEDMKQIEKQIPASERERVRFALFSFDSERDTADRIKKYAKAHGLGPEWVLSRGSAKSTRELAAALGVQYKRSSDGTFQHSNLITLLDSEGIIKKQQAGLGIKGDDMADAAVRLVKIHP